MEICCSLQVNYSSKRSDLFICSGLSYQSSFTTSTIQHSYQCLSEGVNAEAPAVSEAEGDIDDDHDAVIVESPSSTPPSSDQSDDWVAVEDASTAPVDPDPASPPLPNSTPNGIVSARGRVRRSTQRLQESSDSTTKAWG